MSIATAVETLHTLIEGAQKGDFLSAPNVTLLAASKGQSAISIAEAIKAGVVNFGENRVQEANAKWPALREAYPDIRLHLIGQLQTNKVRQAISLFDVIQTVDRTTLADALAEAMRKEKREITCFIQINTGNEPQKAGVAPNEADEFIDYCMNALRLPVVGLMCIPPHEQPPAPHFALLRAMAIRHGLPELSMGMSDDFETAVRMGSTCVRLGRCLFGERE